MFKIFLLMGLLAFEYTPAMVWALDSNQKGKVDTEIVSQVQGHYDRQWRQLALQAEDGDTNGSVAEKCEPSPAPRGSCIKTVCDKLSANKCDEPTELKKIAQLCINNGNGSCISAVCRHLPGILCDDFIELQNIARTCSGLFDSSCIEAVCSRLPSSDCDQFAELKRVVETCKNP